jgi:hypothetical protein
MSELSLFTHVTESVTTNDYYTPKWLFDSMGLEFDIDVCAPVHGIPWIPAKRWFSQADDGLAQEWGGLVWMNPPYSDTTPWAYKFIEHGNGMALMPVSRSKWFLKIWNTPNISMVATPTDFKFETPDGSQKTISVQTFLFAMGDTATEALHGMKLGRVR